MSSNDQDPVHFYVRGLAAVGLDSWNPDSEPNRFSSGLGHNILELYVRLRQMGFPVTLGAIIPANARMVVVFAPHEVQSLRWHISGIWATRRFPIAVIRSDLGPGYHRTHYAWLEIMPNPISVRRSKGESVMYLPPLPQRGLIPRSTGRGGDLKNITLKTNPENIPQYLRDNEFLEKLDQLGFNLMIDAPKFYDGEDQKWHDFLEVDIALLDRSTYRSEEAIHKPPTKLINAWLAGVIPIAAREPAYTSIAREGQNILCFSEPAELLSILRNLRESGELVARLRRGVATRAAEIGTAESAALMYWDILSEGRRAPSHVRGIMALVHGMPIALIIFFKKTVRRLHRKSVGIFTKNLP